MALFLIVCSFAVHSADAQPRSEPYVWRNVAIGGGGFVTGIIFHPTQKDLIYARTDVGGAYRWEAEAKRWVPLMDWIGADDVNLTGIESVAVDPSHPERVYLAAGTYSRGTTAMLRSEDQGRTFKRTDVPFNMGGNEPGRFSGERLAVDPRQGDVLFFGSRRDGLWKSADRGATWHKVESFTNIGSNPTPASDTISNVAGQRRGGGFGANQPVGIIAVVFDSAGKPGSPTPTIYAAVSTLATNLYRSADGGVTWEPVANQPVGLRPNHLVPSPDGTFYLSYGHEPGPNQMSDGAVWKYSPKSGLWSDITPVRPKETDQPFGYGCVAVDAQRPATLMATTFTHWGPHDEIFRSTNGGATWTQLWQSNTITWDHSSAPYTRTRKPHWMGTIVINPLNSDQVLFTTGYGIWGCARVTEADAGRPTHWTFLNQGLEETVPLALISPAVGAHLISGVGDIDGFRHEDVNVSPADGSFAGPRFSSTRDLAFAARHPDLIARIGNAGRDVSVHAAFSENGGKDWQSFGSDPPGGNNGMGRIALSADGETLVWALPRGAAYFTTDRGMTWTNCHGISSAVSIIADPLDVSRFYAFDPAAGKLMVSTNSGLTFESGASFNGSQAGRGVVLAATPGKRGDLWVGSRTLGLHHSTNAGASFNPVNGVDSAEALGFGKAAPGKTLPALYLLGNINRLHAYYRSDDAGETWVRINDDQHQFGAADRPLVVGDPRIYGRLYLTTGGRGIIYGEPGPMMKQVNPADVH